jgi:hypothetical protein
MTNLYGTWEESFQSLYSLKAETELRSPWSVVEIDTKDVDGEVHFSRLLQSSLALMDFRVVADHT